MVVRGERVVFGARRTVRGSIVEWEGTGEVGWSFWWWVNGEEEEGSVVGGMVARWREVERRREGLSTRRRSGEGEVGEGGGWMYASIGGTMPGLWGADAGEGVRVEVDVDDRDRMSNCSSIDFVFVPSACASDVSFSSDCHPSVLSRDRYLASLRLCHVAFAHQPTTSSLSISSRSFLSMKSSIQ